MLFHRQNSAYRLYRRTMQLKQSIFAKIQGLTRLFEKRSSSKNLEYYSYILPHGRRKEHALWIN